MQAAVATDQGEPRTRHHGRGHIAALDGLRGIAVLGVMSTHLITGDLGHVSFPLLFAMRACLEGVDLFFVLSGFLISGILLDSLSDGGYFRKFYARRALRIFPLYYGVLLVAFALTRPLHIEWHGAWLSFVLYVQNLRVLPAVWDMPDARYVQFSHLWSLAVEEQFYLAWPLLLWLVRGSRRVLLLCAAGVVGSFLLRWAMYHAHVDVNVVTTHTLCRVDELLLGATLVLVVRSRLGPALLRWAGPVFCVGVVLEFGSEWLGYHHFYGRAEYLMESLVHTQVGLLCTLLVAWCLQTGSPAERAFQWKPLRFFGKYSYGLYVLHALPLPAFHLGLLRLRTLGVGRLAARAIIGALEFGLAVLAAYCSFHLYEEQFLRLKRYFDYAA